MEIVNVGIGRRKILLISGNWLIFVNYDEPDEVKQIASKYKIDYVISSDCHGDAETFLLPLSLPGIKIYLGDYYPYIPMYVKYRERNEDLVKFTKEKFEAMTRLISKHKDEAIYLYGNHDPKVFDVKYECKINGFKFVFQHSLVNKLGKQPIIKHYYDFMEENWKTEASVELGLPGKIVPQFTLLQENESLEIPDVDYIIVGHLSDYSKLGIKNLFTVDASNSSVVEYQRKVVDEMRKKHVEKRIEQLENQLDKLYIEKISVIGNKREESKVEKEIKMREELLKKYKEKKENGRIRNKE